MSMSSHNVVERPFFSKWRNRLWPIQGHEAKKLLPLLLMKIGVSFNYTVLHATKDTVTVTTSGAEAIPVLKGWVVILFAFLFMLGYSKLSNHLSKSRLFYATIAPFLIFFALYGFVLYPYQEWLCPHKIADRLVDFLGHERAHWVSVFRYWMNSAFFLMAELWGGVVIALLFWGFANQISTISEASRFYTLLSAGGHLGVIAAGPLIWYYAQKFSHNQFALTVQWLMGIVTLVTCMIVFCYWWINRRITLGSATKKQTPATKLSLKESLHYMIRSPYLGCIALMVIGYSLSMNMVEVTWKAILKTQYPNARDYQAFMGIVSSITGFVSLFLAFFVGGNMIRKFGWRGGALFTPIMLGIISVIFFLLYFTRFSFSGVPLLVGGGSLMLVVICGAAHNIACKSMKYCLFDTTKEMAYIPLDEESKVKGKAAVDVVAARFGKSGSSWIQAGLIEFVGHGSIFGIVSFLSPCVLVAVVCWIVSVYALGKRFKQKTEQNQPLNV